MPPESCDDMAPFNGVRRVEAAIKPSLVNISGTLQLEPQSTSALANASEDSKDFIIKALQNMKCQWLRLSWHDYTSSSRCRLIPMARVLAILRSGRSLNLTITQACFGLLQTDKMIPEVTGTGMYETCPDWSSLRLGPISGHANVFLNFNKPHESDENFCPRTLLRETIQKAAQQDLEFLVGFELEFIILERNQETTSRTQNGQGNLVQGGKYCQMRNDSHAWSMTRALADIGRQGSFVSVIDDLLDALVTAGIEIEQFHPESAPGQYEIVLPPLPPMVACDTLLQTRHIIEATAARHGFHMTLHPKPFVGNAGSASHMHMSLSSPGGDTPEIYESFYAGILKHYPSIIAFTYSNPASYERMVDSFWAGGRWVAWGTQNKEAPLRKCDASHWEMKTIDGLANPYFAMASIISAGVNGVANTEPLVWKDCPLDPAKLTAEQRKEFGISQMFPKDLKEALKVLKYDDQLGALLGHAFVQRYIDCKTAEMCLLESMNDEEMREWLLERY